MSASPTVRPSAVVGARPWFRVNTGMLNTREFAWRAHLHSEIAGLDANSASSPLVATSESSRIFGSAVVETVDQE